MKTAATEILKIARVLVSSVTVDESDGLVCVHGSYTEMQPLIPRLKNMGFRWDGAKRVWYIPKDKMTALKADNLQKLMGGHAEAQLAVVDGIRALLNSTAEKLKGSKWFTLLVGDGVSADKAWLEGKTYDVKEECFHAGGKWTGKAYSFSLSGMKMDVAKTLADKVLDIDRRYEAAFQRGLAVAKRLEGTEVADVKFSIRDKKLRIIPPGRGFNDAIKSVFERAVWSSDAWEVSLYRLTDKLADDLTKAIVEVKWKMIYERQNQLQKEYKELAGKFTLSRGSGYGGKPFQPNTLVQNSKSNIDKGEPEWLYVLKTSQRHFREDGLSFGVGDDSGYVYIAECRAATPEEIAPVAQAKELRQKEQEQKVQAEKDLHQVVEDIQHGELPPRNPDGTGLVPRGQVLDISGKNHQMYGGGDWFVIGSDYIWYVKNNGADGDSWDANNVSTGGAGAIGWRVPHSKALEDKIRSIFLAR
jgi:hypothetical protein